MDQWLSPLLAFVGAGFGSVLVYRASRDQERNRRVAAAIEMLASSDPRQRALGRARVVHLGGPRTKEAQRTTEIAAVLLADVREVCPPEVRQRLAALDPPDDELSVRVSDDGRSRVQGDSVLVAASLVDAARAYVEVVGGPPMRRAIR